MWQRECVNVAPVNCVNVADGMCLCGRGNVSMWQMECVNVADGMCKCGRGNVSVWQKECVKQTDKKNKVLVLNKGFSRNYRMSCKLKMCA